MQNPHSQIIKISTKGWYVETRTGFEGPFDDEEEATSYFLLIKSSNAARVEFAGLEYTPENNNSKPLVPLA